ncbi:MAG TPA: hypothetical protein VGE02_02060 [Gemmatimonadales bacterium]
MPSIVARLTRPRLPKRRPAVMFGAAAAMLMAACAEDGAMGPGEDASVVRVNRYAAALEIRNPGDEPLGYTVIEAELATRALLAFCTDPGPECRRLPARGSVTVPYAQIGGYEAGDREAIVHTWRVVPDGEGGHEVADVLSRRVGL